MTTIYRSKADGTLWRELSRAYQYHAGLGDMVTIATLRASDGAEIRLASTDEDEWNDLVRLDAHSVIPTIPAAIAVVRCYSPNGTPTTVVTCYAPNAIINAVNRTNPADVVKVQAL